MAGTLTRSLEGAFWLSQLVLGVACALAIMALLSQQRALQSATVTRELVEHTDRTLLDLEDAETGQRGYLLTGEPSYLAPYTAADSRIRAELATLGRLTSGDVSLQRALADLARATAEKQRELTRTISLYQSSDVQAALELVKSGRGKALMDEIRAAVGSMHAREEQLLAGRMGTAATNTAVGWFAVIALGVLGLALLWFIRYVAARDRIRIQQSQERLDTTLTSIGDGVMATDRAGRIERMNPVAERLTGWSEAEARGRPLEAVFRIVNESTRQPVESPVQKVLREGVVVGLANHTVLLSRDGREYVIEDSGAPIRRRDGRVDGVVLVFQDATSKHALQLEREKLIQLIEQSTDFVGLADPEGRLVYLNPSGQRMVGYGSDRPYEGRSIVEYVADESLSFYENEFLPHLRESGRAQGEMRFKHLTTGERIDVHRTLFVVRDPKNGQAIGHGSVSRDIGELKRARAREQFLHNLGEKLRAQPTPEAVEQVAAAGLGHELRAPLVGFVAVDSEGYATIETLLRDEHVRSAGVQRIRLAGSEKSGLGVLGEHDIAVSDVDDDPLNGASPIMRVGVAVGARALVTAGLSDDGNPGGHLFVAQREPRAWTPEDVSLVRAVADQVSGAVAQVRAQKQRAESERRYRQVLEALPQLVWTCASNGEADYLSVQWLQYTGTRLADNLGYGWAACIHPADRQRILTVWQDSVRRCAALDTEVRIRRADGFYCWFKQRAIPLRQSDGSVQQWFGTSTEITDLIEAREAIARNQAQLEKRVEERTRALEDANSELQAFANTVAHDLRAPLRNIQGYANAILEDEDRLSAEGVLYTQRMAESADRLDGLIQDLLGYSRLSRGEMRLEPIDLTSLLRQVLADLASEVAAREAQVTVQGDLPIVSGHRATLGQILINLISNAVKFVASDVLPQVTVFSVSMDGCAHLTIQDNGIGIPVEHRERIFAVFERLHGSEEYPGTGIGLAIVRRGIERMGGRVRVESAPGGGSRFTVELPLAAPDTPQSNIPGASQ